MAESLLLKDKVALVTGASGALGSAVVKLLLDQGALVVAAYRNAQKFKELAESTGEGKTALSGVEADVTLETGVERLLGEAIRKHGRVDVLLNLAGGYLGGQEIAQTQEKDWDFLIDLNLKSAFLCSRAVLPFMMKENYGRIVSVAARPAVEKKGRVKSGAYAVSKAGVVVLMETIAEEVKKFNITANCIVPSTIDTPENRRDIPAGDFSKWVKPEDIAAVVLFLASEFASVTSGAAIPVYGKA
jgi:NAD(P)-dependent dehydrogenase (short-subunit alcohol dehydrogenase family)